MREADDLDFVLRDALRDVASATPESTRVWAALHGRIEAARPPARFPCLRLAARGYPATPEWTLDWHLMSLGRIAR